MYYVRKGRNVPYSRNFFRCTAFGQVHPPDNEISTQRRNQRRPDLHAAMIMSDKTKPDSAEPFSAEGASEQVPDWLGNRLRRMFTEVMDEPVPDEFKALLKQLEDKERGS